MNFIEKLKFFMEIAIFGNPIRDYLLSLIMFFGLMFGFSVAKRLIIFNLTQIAKKVKNDFINFITGLFAQIGKPVFFVVALYISSFSLTLNDRLRSFITYGLIIVITIRIILILQDVVKYAITKSYRRRFPPDDLASDVMTKNLTLIFQWIIWAAGVIFILDNMGVNISALVAGIGIGGIAVAMASQAILGDAFSALSIYLDKPFEIGDFIIVGDLSGTVEHVGVKTTRIRSLSGEQLIFSNADLTKNPIKNYKRMETRRVDFKIGVVYQTPLEKVKKIPQIIKNIFDNMKGVRLESAHFLSLGDFSLVYEIVYNVLSADYIFYMDKQQEINFSLMEIFAKEGIEFAYPTQTLYLTKEK